MLPDNKPPVREYKPGKDPLVHPRQHEIRKFIRAAKNNFGDTADTEKLASKLAERCAWEHLCLLSTKMQEPYTLWAMNVMIEHVCRFSENSVLKARPKQNLSSVTANQQTRLYFSKPDQYRAEIQNAMHGKSIAAPRDDTNAVTRHAMLRKVVPGISDWADRLKKMNGDTAELDKDAASFDLLRLQSSALPKIHVPLELIVPSPRPGQYYKNWDGGHICQDDVKRNWVPVPYHSIIRVYRGFDQAADHPVKYLFMLRFFPCQTALGCN